MKTYSYHTWDEVFQDNNFWWTEVKSSKAKIDVDFCSCLRRGSDNKVRAYEDCKNCLGYGIPPISFEELK